MSNYLSSTHLFIYKKETHTHTHTHTHTDHLLVSSGICIYHRNTKLVREREREKEISHFFSGKILSNTIDSVDSIAR